METQTERKVRSYEELRTVEDYLNEFSNITGLAGELDGATEETLTHIEKVLTILSKGLEAKYKYIDKISRKWRKKQGLFSRIHDTMIEKQEAKRLKQQLENEKILAKIEEIKNKSKLQQMEHSGTAQSSGIIASQAETKGTEVLDTIEQPEAEVLSDGESSSLLEF